jgi:hypothetical protein
VAAGHARSVDPALRPPGCSLFVRESFVGVPYLQSELEVTTLEPTDESWELGDRELVCMVQDPTGRSPELEGANR